MRFLLTFTRLGTFPDQAESAPTQSTLDLPRGGPNPIIHRLKAGTDPTLDVSKTNARPSAAQLNDPVLYPSSQRESRCRRLKKRIGKLNFRIIFEASRDKSSNEKNSRSCIGLASAGVENGYRKVSELTGSGFLGSPATPLPMYNAFEYRIDYSISEMSSDSPLVELDSPSHEHVSKLQRRGAQRRRMNKPAEHNIPGTPIAELAGDPQFLSPVAGDASNSRWCLEAQKIPDQVSTSHYLALDVHPPARQSQHLDVFVDVCALEAPELSPQSATQKLSPITPMTPSSLPTSVPGCVPMVGLVLNSDQAFWSSNQHSGIKTLCAHDLLAGSDLWGPDGSTLIGDMSNVDPYLPVAHDTEGSCKQSSADYQDDLLPINQMPVPTGFLQDVDMSSHPYVFDGEYEGLSDRIDTVSGTGEQNDNLIHSHAYMSEPPGSGVWVEPSCWTASNVELKDYVHSSRHEEPGFDLFAVDPSATVERQFPVVDCGQCEKRFTGQYALGNMKRHAKQMHPLKPRRDNNCRVCKKSYKRSDALRTHERKVHSTSISVR